MASPVLRRHNRELQSKSSGIHSTNHHRSIRRRRVHDQKKRAVSYLSLDIVAKILILLPVKIVVRFKCVCKSWRKLISSESFIDMHLELTKRRPPRLILFPHIQCDAVTFYSLNAREGTADLVFSEVGSVRRSREWLTLLPNACRGLNLLRGVCGMLHVINVWTRQVVRLPQGIRVTGLILKTVVGLGFSSTSKKYKVVRLPHYRNEEGGYSVGCEVYTLGGGSGGWRKVCTTPPYPVHQEYAFSNGAMHWTIDGPFCRGKPWPHAVVSFSVEDEKFALVPLPPPTLDAERSYFFAAEGCLCITYADFCRLDLWMLKDYHGGVWTRNYTLDLRNELYALDCKPFAVYDGNIWFLDKQHEEILYFDAKTGARKLVASMRRLSYYDPENGSMRKVLDEYSSRFSSMCISLHEESLVSLR